MNKKRVLITYASYGSGHKTVANYIYEYLSNNSNYEIKIIDLMDYENIFGYLTKKSYENNFKNQFGGVIMSIVYEFFDHKITTLPYKSITKSVFKNKKLQDDITTFNPDLLISTHFFGNIIVGMLNSKGLTNSRIISIITDYKSHEAWIKDMKHIDALIVSNDMVKNELVVENNIDENKIYSYGIPISENFKNLDDKETIKNKYHVNNGKKTFLFFAGGSIGSTFSYKYFKRLLEEEFDINVIYVCGKNDKLKKKALELVRENDYQNVTVLGFSNEVNNLLNISDVVITKPGGITITEALEVKKPMLLIPGNGANEIYNARFIYRNGYGINCRTARKLVKSVGQILYRRHVLLNMQRKLSKYEDNKSIERIAKLADKLLRR